MKATQTLVTCALLLSGVASAAPAFNGTVKGTVNRKQIDVKVVCEREKIGKSDWLYANSEPVVRGELKDQDGDGIAVSASLDITGSGAAFQVMIDGREYTFGKLKGLKVTSTGTTIKSSFSPATKEPQPDKAFDVDLTVHCP